MKKFINQHKWEVPLYIIAAGLPLIIYFHTQYIGLEGQAWFPNQTTWTDFFLYGKSRCVHFIGLFMAAVLIVGTFRKKNHKFVREWLLVFIFGVLQLISAFLSIAPRQSFLGGIEQYESVWVLLAYLVIGCYAYQCTLKGKEPEFLMKALFLGVFLSSLIGVTQLFQMDYWESGIGKSILIPETYQELREGLRFSFFNDQWQPVYLASYNPNYAGIYLLMILPCMLLWKDRRVRIAGIIGAVCLAGTMSKTVLAATMIVFLIAMMLFKNRISQKNRKWIAGAAAMILLVTVGVFVFDRNTNYISDEQKLQAVVCEEEYVHITYQNEEIWLRDIPKEDGGAGYEICYEDGSHVALKWNEESGEMDPYAEELQGLHFKVYQKDGIHYTMFRYEDIPFRFTKDLGTGKYEYVSINGKIDELQTAETILGGYDGLISGRGYIWSRTLPVILKHPLLGTGPDTFMVAFPQDDYVARSNLGHAFFTQILTNAHSLYLQMAVQTGLPALFCFLLFVFTYLGKSWKLYYGKTSYTSLERIGVGIFLGVTGYLICGITFASCACTTPIFWLLLGTGIGINTVLTNLGSTLYSK